MISQGQWTEYVKRTAVNGWTITEKLREDGRWEITAACRLVQLSARCESLSIAREGMVQRLSGFQPGVDRIKKKRRTDHERHNVDDN